MSQTTYQAMYQLNKQHKSRPKPLLCFTDGAAKSNAKNANAGWGVYIPKFKYYNSGSMKGTNNQAELEAVKQLLLYLSEIDLFSSVLIYTDSKYVIGIFVDNNKYKVNVDLINEIKELRKNIKVKVGFKHVEAHTKKTDFISRCNAVVDKLASDAAESITKKLKHDLTDLQNKINELESMLETFDN